MICMCSGEQKYQNGPNDLKVVLGEQKLFRHHVKLFSRGQWLQVSFYLGEVLVMSGLNELILEFLLLLLC